MFIDLIDYPIESERLQIEARQVLRDLNLKPNLLLCITLTGTYFAERALEPFMTVGGIRSRFVEISEDGQQACAYFDTPPPLDAAVEFGYGNMVFLRVAQNLSPDTIRVLDRNRLPRHTINLDRFFGQIG